MFYELLMLPLVRTNSSARSEATAIDDPAIIHSRLSVVPIRVPSVGKALVLN